MTDARNYRDERITVRRDNPWSDGPCYPAVNVKAYYWPSVDTIMAHFGCTEATAEKASELTWECQAEAFWECAPETAVYHLKDAFGVTPEVEQQGRSGGWLVVTGLPDVAGWNLKRRQAWHQFERAIENDLAFIVSEEAVLALIRANEWAMDDASLGRMIAVALAP